MSQIVINNTTVCQPTADPSLAGRTPPLIKQAQLRPSPQQEIQNARQYSDNQTPYISIYQDFNLPIQFQPTRIIPNSSPPRLEAISSITCRMTNCFLESPQPTDNPSITEPDEKGKAKLKVPKFDAESLAYYNETNFFEPKVLGETTAGFVSICKVLATKNYTPVPGQTQNYTVKGYFTERNFFDREWITEWGFLIYRINHKGVAWNCPLLDQLVGSMIGINKAIWIQSSTWTPNEFFQIESSLAKKYESPQADKYINGAKKIIQYKPSEIGSLRFYFTFTVTTDFPGVPTETFQATMSVKYNQEFGEKRLQKAQKKQNDKATSPGGEEQKGAETPEAAQTTQATAANDELDAEFADAMAASPEELDAALTLY